MRISAGVVLLMTAALTLGSGTLAAPGKSALYIVQLAGLPIGSYAGDIKGLKATKPAPGDKVDTRSAAARAYRAYLTTERRDALQSAGLGGRSSVYTYDTAFNGFAMRLTTAEALRLEHATGVVRVTRSEIWHADTVSTPAFLGLDGSGGVWSQQFGGSSHAGEGMIVGVLDTGFWPESPSFAPLPEPRPDQATIDAKWSGTCDEGSDPNPDNNITCNNKVIGARWYDAGGLSASVPDEFHSPRDRNLHGSHTASTAAGDEATAVINGLTVGTASGMAPAARLAIYKIGWHQPDATASGSTADIAAAIDDATSDGVDVINLSFSGSQTYVVDPVELAFMFASDAGVFTAVSAGNSGPTASTVAHNSPWVTTVAASTHDRSFTRTMTLGSGTTYSGPGTGPAVPSSPLVLSTTVGLAGADATAVRLCFSDGDSTTAGVQPVLDPALVAGKIVVCDRGTNARTDKSLAVKNAGGVGMVLANTSAAQSLNADFHFVPTIHVNNVDGAAIKAYVSGSDGTATASLSEAIRVSVEAPAMAAFSSNGPARAGGGDLLKPDITAPGVDVIAAVSPVGDNGNLYDAESGTSMSSPHIAGIAALLIAKHPTWSPMAIKSAMMTSASQVDNKGNPILGPDGVHAATPLNFGSGHVTPPAAFNPGLVYDSNLADWVRYGCGLGQIQLVYGAGVCSSFGSIDPSNLNYATIAIGDLAGSQTVTRTVTNVSTDDAGLYNVSVQAPAGITVAVSPTTLTVPPGQSKSFTVTISRTTATLGAYAFGSITWTEKKGKTSPHAHSVRSNIAVRPVAAAAPSEVSGTGTSGSTAIKIQPGYTGTLTATPHGLAADSGITQTLTGTNTNFNSAAPAAGPSVLKTTVVVPAGSRLARFATYDADYGAGTDLDLFVYTAGTNTLRGQSAGGTAEESVTLTAADSYDVYVVLFAQPGGATGDLDVHEHTFVVPDAASTLAAAPASQSVTTAVPATVTASWSGLTAGTRYLGTIDFGDGTNTIGTTIVSVTG
ncbi:MAG TPA: S8 family serine peptidase [Candidatus Limnocylindrales bacterium]|nr:S8 family serine peptidase [Candidatus Limnocylindrales bacterium]